MNQVTFLGLRAADTLTHPDGRMWRVTGSYCTNESGTHLPAVMQIYPDGTLGQKRWLCWDPELDGIVDVYTFTNALHPVFNNAALSVARH